MNYGLSIFDEEGDEVFGTEATTSFFFKEITLSAGSSGVLKFPELAGRVIMPVSYPVGGLDNISKHKVFHMVTAEDQLTSEPKIRYFYPEYGAYQSPTGTWLPQSHTKGASTLMIWVSGAPI